MPARRCPSHALAPGRRTRSAALLLALAFGPAPARAQEPIEVAAPPPLRFTLTVTDARSAGPVDVVLDDAPVPKTSPSLARLDDGSAIRVDVLARGVDGRGRLRLRWVATHPLEAGQARHTLEFVADGREAAPFAWSGPLEARTLALRGKAVWSFAAAFDPQDFDATFKPFHQLFLADGETLLTKGLGGSYPHHRGLFVGWNQTRCDGETHDFWHCVEGRHQRRIDTVESPFPVVADESSSIEWRDEAGHAIVRERRTLSAWDLGDARRVIDVVVTLACGSEHRVELRGDPQHAGCQLRLAEEVATHADATRYERSAGAKDSGNDVWRDCDWAMVRARIGGRDVKVLHASAAGANARVVYSTRPYGRFGAFAEFALSPDAPLELRYRVVIADGDQALDPALESAGFRAELRASCLRD
ncbi:MAG: PmoA family protein [Planctomycetes bacterium]|nr:PmoA family protein [Planctomycetota bacterium]